MRGRLGLTEMADGEGEMTIPLRARALKLAYCGLLLITQRGGNEAKRGQFGATIEWVVVEIEPSAEEIARAGWSGRRRR